jgi:hypothetical protein
MASLSRATGGRLPLVEVPGPSGLYRDARKVMMGIASKAVHGVVGVQPVADVALIRWVVAVYLEVAILSYRVKPTLLITP